MTFFRQDGMQYQWFGGFGSIFTSRERGRRLGDLRFIKGRLFRVFMLTDGFWPFVRTVHWTLAGNIDADLIRKIRREMFEID